MLEEGGGSLEGETQGFGGPRKSYPFNKKPSLVHHDVGRAGRRERLHQRYPGD